MKKICFTTTSRSDFGMLNELIKETIKGKNFFVQLIVSGKHADKIYWLKDGKIEKITKR